MRWSAFAPLVFLCLLVLLFFWPLVFGGRVLYWGTPVLQFYPWRELAAHLYHGGQVPLWNPYLGFGAPLAANAQSGVFYPLNLPYLLLPVEQAMGYTVVLHVALAGVFTYLYLRSLEVSSWGSVVAALGFMFSGFLIGRAGFLSMVAAAPWLPLILLSIERLAGGGGPPGARLHWLGLGCLGWGLQLLAGHPQLSYYSLGAVLLYGGLRAVMTLVSSAPARRTARVLAALGITGAFLVLGGGLAAIQLLPTWELVGHSVRASGAEYDYATTYSLWPGQLVGVLAPNFFGSPATGDYWGPGNYWEGASYIGILTLVLALVGILRSRQKVRWFFLGLAILSILLALGHYGPLYPWTFGALPGFHFFQAPSRMLYLFTFSGAVLAGLGWDAAEAARDSTALRRVGVWALVGGITMVAVVLATSYLEGGTTRLAASSIQALVRLGLLLGGVGALLLLRERSPRFAGLAGRVRPSVWRPALLLLLMVDLFSFGMQLNPTTDPRLYREPASAPVPFLKARAGMDRVATPEEAFVAKFFRHFSFKTFGSGDWQDRMSVRDDLVPNWAASEHLFEAHNYDPLRLERPTQFAAALEKAGHPARLWAMANVRFLYASSPPSGSGWSPVPEGRGDLFALAAPLPRAYLVPTVRLAADGDQALRMLLAEDLDPGREAVVEGPPAGMALPVSQGEAPGEATVQAYSAHRVSIGTRSPSAALLVLSDSYYPGWKVWVDGEETALLRTNYAFRGVVVPQGEHQVEFRYEPRSFQVGAAISGLTLLLLLGIVLAGLQRRTPGGPA